MTERQITIPPSETFPPYQQNVNKDLGMRIGTILFPFIIEAERNEVAFVAHPNREPGSEPTTTLFAYMSLTDFPSYDIPLIVEGLELPAFELTRDMHSPERLRQQAARGELPAIFISEGEDNKRQVYQNLVRYFVTHAGQGVRVDWVIKLRDPEHLKTALEIVQKEYGIAEQDIPFIPGFTIEGTEVIAGVHRFTDNDVEYVSTMIADIEEERLLPAPYRKRPPEA